MAGILTLALIKPHAYLTRKSGKIITRAEEERFAIIQSKITEFTPYGVANFLATEKAKDYYPALERELLSGPCWVLVLSKPNAVEEWLRVLGDENPALADEGTIRKEFGQPGNIVQNAVYSPTTDHDARRDIAFFFARELKLAQSFFQLQESKK